MRNENISASNDMPLVSVVIISYNSAGTITDTLNSIAGQRYPNLELIISDDGSSDDTVNIARKWILEKWANRPAKVLEVHENTGIPANMNRGNAAATGEWIKGVAADDCLLPNCIEDNINFIRKHPEAQLVFSREIFFTGSIGGKSFKQLKVYPEETEIPTFFRKSAEEQMKYLLVKNDLSAAPVFYRKSLLTRFPYNELYKGMEDWPMWLTLTKAGVKLEFMDKETALYRIDSTTISRAGSKRLYSTSLFDAEKLHYLLERRPLLTAFAQSDKSFKKAIRKYDRRYLLYDLCCFLFRNKKNLFTSVARHAISRMLKCV